jgi:hypothetical protein
MNKALIDNSFDPENENKILALDNIFVRYGISDKCLWLLDAEHERSIDSGIVELANSSIVDTIPEMPSLGRAISSIEGVNTKFSRSM